MANQRRPQRKRAPKTGGAPGSVRIIGGDWRGRRLPVADAPGLRPSGDRVRETLFNWLQPRLAGARCADLFAGSGVLGFEAASRGAREVVLVERLRPLAAMLCESAERLRAGQVEVINADALEWLQGRPGGSLDIVFVDPPFESGLAQCALERLAESGCLAAGGLVYVESPRHRHAGAGPRHRHAGAGPCALQVVSPRGFVQAREKEIGEVHLELLEWAGPG